MAKLVLSDISSGYVSVSALNSNFTAIETAIENTLSRDGTTPNHMTASLDMNGYPIINLGRAINNTDALSYAQFLEIVAQQENLTGVIPITWEFLSLGDTTYNIPLAGTNAVDMYIVSDNGLVVSPSSYSVNATTQTLTFTADVPPAGHEVVIRLFGKTPETVGSGITVNNVKKRYFFTVIGAETVFITNTPLDLNSTDVYLNGVKLIQTTDYTVSGMNVTLTFTPTVADILEVIVTNSIVAASQTVFDAQAAAAAAATSAAAAAQSVIDASAAGAAAGAIAGGEGVAWLNKAINYTATHAQGIFADTTSGSFTITLPAAPSVGQFVYVVDVTGSFSSNPLTVGRNSEYIMGVAEDMTINTANVAVKFLYSGAANGWRLI